MTTTIDGQDITNVPTLLNVVSEAGLDRSRAEVLLSGDGGVAAIRAAEEQARRSGVRGVPFYVINGRLALSGAREPSDFLAAFEQAAALPDDEGSVCTIGRGGKPSC
jgi:predicted DsbA family dithiol-disulfide isomerase